MRGIRQYSSILAGIVFLVGGTVWAQQATNGRPVVRRYTDRIQLHETPSDLKIPEEMSTPSDRQQPIPEEKKAFVPLMPGVSGGALPYVPPPPVVSPGKEKKGGNWILPPTPEDIEKEKGSESDPSGWGWLADDVKDRQDRIDREVQKKAEEEEPGLTGVLPSNVRKGDTGLMIDNTYKPVASYELMQDMKRTDPQDMVLDTRAGSGRDAAMKSAGLAPVDQGDLGAAGSAFQDDPGGAHHEVARTLPPERSPAECDGQTPCAPAHDDLPCCPVLMRQG